MAGSYYQLILIIYYYCHIKLGRPGGHPFPLIRIKLSSFHMQQREFNRKGNKTLKEEDACY